MLQRFFILATIIFTLVMLGRPAMAGQLSVNAAVLPARTIYLNPSGNIARIESNTSQNIIPLVVGGALDSAIQQQYQLILSSNGGNLGSGIYMLSTSEKVQLQSKRAFTASLARLEFD